MIKIFIAKLLMTKVLDGFFAAVLGLTIVDLFISPLWLDLNTVGGILQMVVSFVGLIYFILSIPHKIKTNRRKLKMQDMELELIDEQRKGVELDNDLKRIELEKKTT